MQPWSVICRAVAENPAVDDGNQGGLLVLLTDGSDEIEMCRVAFVRRNSSNPEVSFDEQLQIELRKAERAAEVVTQLMDEHEQAMAEKFVEAGDRIREILGDRPEVPA